MNFRDPAASLAFWGGRLLRSVRLFYLVFVTVVLAGCQSLGMAPASSGADAPPAGVAQAPVLPGGPLSPIASTSLSSSKVQGLQPPQDLWSRIRQGFAIPDLDTELAQDRTLWYASKPEYMQRMTERSSKYLFHIVEELERRNMPTELALLPFVESAFNPDAVSHAKAAGMWQFMPATGTYFDLTQNAFRDDRRDVLESTRAALDYLEKLYGMFGDWHLALAAYNWGEGSVGRARAKNQNEGKGVSYTELTMPEETRYYVPKFQAIKNIVANPRAYGVELAEIGNHPYFEMVDIKRDMDVDMVAQLAGVTVADFRSLNPSHNGPVIFVAATESVLLPWDNAQTFKRNLADHRDGRLASWTVWKAPKTMNAAEIARSLGIKEDVLRSVNRIPANMLVATGSAILVPRNGNEQADVTAELAHNGQLKLQPLVTKRKVTVTARKGETVSTLARRYGASAADVASWNKVARNARFRTGQKLVIYRSVSAAKVANNAKGATRKRR